MVTLVLDALKGAAAVVVAKVILGLPIIGKTEHIGTNAQSWTIAEAYWWVAVAAIAVMLGHIFPVWLQFRGGKGVATGVGVFLTLAPMVVAMAALVFVVVVALTKYVSLGSMVAAVAIPVFVWLQHAFVQPVEPLAPIMTAAIAGATLIVFAHRQNIRRLVQGNESRFK
jgi:glycerol-3-phosphate acyltransferase PlsY